METKEFDDEYRSILGPKVSRTALRAALLGAALSWVTAATAVDIVFVPRSQDKSGVRDVFFQGLNQSEIDLGLAGGGKLPEEDLGQPLADQEAPVIRSIDDIAIVEEEPVPPIEEGIPGEEPGDSPTNEILSEEPLPSSEGSLDESQEFPPDGGEDFSGFDPNLFDPGVIDDGGVFDSFSFPPYVPPAQVPTAGSPAGVVQGVPMNGFGAGMPIPGTPGPAGGLKYRHRHTFKDVELTGDPNRSTDYNGNFYREDMMLSFDESPKNGLQYRGQANMRFTDDPETLGNGNHFRLEGQFAEVSRPSDFLVRVGDVTPQFSNYTFARAGNGVHYIKRKDYQTGLMQLELFGARTQRESDPGVFRRQSMGGRAARVWQLSGQKGSAGVGGTLVDTNEDRASVSLAGSTGATFFPRSNVGSINSFYDNPKGFHCEAEFARSSSDFENAGTPQRREGIAFRQQASYARSGKSIAYEHERIDPGFDAVEGGASPDIDRQSIFVNVPIDERYTVSAFWQHVYNDVENLLGRTGANTSYNLSLTMIPFVKNAKAWLKNVNMSVIGNFSRSIASDGTTDRFDRDWTYGISDTIGKLTLSYNIRGADNTDYLVMANSRNPHNSSYQIGYDVIGNAQNTWKVSPYVRLSHDHDLDIWTGRIDLGNNVSMGFNGNYKDRTTFSFQRDERLQRMKVADRQSHSETYRGQCDVLLDPKTDTKGSVQFSRDHRRDSGQASLFEERAMVALERLW